MRKICFLVFAFASSFFFTTCGLDTLYDLSTSSPTTAVHEPVYNSSDYASNYFEFVSAKNANSDGDFNFLGTAVYYRIYASYSTMQSHQSAISSVNTASDYSAAATKMIGYGYKQLSASDGSMLMITTENDRVRIRLTNYGDAGDSANEYRARITATGVDKIPRRSIGSNKTFDFGRHGNNKYTPQENYDLPASGDEDFENGTVSDNKYYVNMYAVAVGRDTTYTLFYSNVLHLGAIPINASAENN